MKETTQTIETTETLFDAGGGFDINNNLEPIPDSMGTIIGYKLPDGRKVRLVIALEVENSKTDEFEYITNEQEMHDLGFENLNYNKLDFYPQFQS